MAAEARTEGRGAEDAVRDANSAFYAAFEARDFDAMADLWEHSDRAVVTHPGWPTLRGWARIAGSWEAIFRNTPFIQFVLTGEEVSVTGDVAWVTLDENILQTTGGADGDGDELAGAHVAALNLFVHDGARWRMVAHHGSPVGAEG
ncbi:MAG: nuclear transport factor 2 family protein [Acidimicrobiia bacterium]|jgi:ketosteroid isomerase-like protein